jgi:hypothetical protein
MWVGGTVKATIDAINLACGHTQTFSAFVGRIQALLAKYVYAGWVTTTGDHIAHIRIQYTTRSDTLIIIKVFVE